jgi:D-arabinose 5-phosphate isomerase GutQ
MLVGDGDARDGLDDLRLLAAGDLVIELSWSSNTEKWTKVAKTSGAKPD